MYGCDGLVLVVCTTEAAPILICMRYGRLGNHDVVEYVRCKVKVLSLAALPPPHSNERTYPRQISAGPGVQIPAC